MQGNVHFVSAAVFGQPHQTVLRGQFIGDSFLDDRLTVAHAHQTGTGAVSGYGNGAVTGNQVLPGRAKGELVEIFKGSTDAFRHQKQHAIRAGEAEGGPESVFQRAGKTHAALFGFRVGKTERQQLTLDETFQIEGRCGNKGKDSLFFHGIPLRKLFPVQPGRSFPLYRKNGEKRKQFQVVFGIPI